jgi:hypothetical protein
MLRSTFRSTTIIVVIVCVVKSINDFDLINKYNKSDDIELSRWFRNDVAPNNSRVSSNTNQTRHLEEYIQSNHTDLFIEYRLLPDIPFLRNDTAEYACRNGMSGEPLNMRKELPSNHPFNYSISIRTNLNILVMGDSLAIEFGSWLQMAAGAQNKTFLKSLKWHKSFAEGLTIAHVQGGGSVSYWRMLAFWDDRGKKRKLPNRGRGWREAWLKQLLSSLQRHTSMRIDVLIFRISHPWISMDEVTTTALINQIEYAKRRLGEGLMIIFLTAPMNNNVVSEQDFIQFRAMNTLVTSFVKKVRKPNIFLSDIGSYMDNVIMWNSIQMGLNTSSPSYLYHFLKPSPKQDYRHHIVQVCSEYVEPLSQDCQRNLISYDGLHFCMETLGPRIFANWACLIKCSFATISRSCNELCHEYYMLQGEQYNPHNTSQ